MESNATNCSARNNYIDIWRLLAAIAIVFFHFYHLDNIKIYPFKGGGKIYVEFFYMVTGYYTYSHVFKRNATAKDSILYTISKYSRFWIFTIPYTMIVYGIHCIFSEKTQSVLHTIFESLLIVKGTNVGQLWFLVALLPIIPLFFIISAKLKPLFMFSCSLAVYLHYYFVYQLYPSHYPVFYYRAIAGICSGVLIYYLRLFCTRFSKEKYIKVYTVLGNIALLVAYFASFFNILDFKLAVICFTFGLTFLFCSKPHKNNRFVEVISSWGRDYSLSIYIVHLQLADLIAFFSKNVFKLSTITQSCLYFSGVIVIAVVLESISGYIKNGVVEGKSFRIK